jgi:hypothetical protein
MLNQFLGPRDPGRYPAENDLMSFEVEFIACNDADRVERSVNPLTGGPFVWLGGTLTDAEREAIHELLDSVGAVSVGDGDAFAARFSDGGSASIWFAGYHENEIRLGAITIEQLSPEMSSWMHKLFKFGNLAITTADTSAPPIVCSDQSAQAIANRWPCAPVVKSSDELHRLLAAIAAEAPEKKRPWWKFW